METLRYNSVQPNVVKDYYQGGDTIQFVVNNVGRQVVQGSWRLEGKLYFGGNRTGTAPNYEYSANDTLNPDNTNWVPYDGVKDVKYDNLAGGHTFIQQVDTYFGSSLVEAFREYPRYVALETSCNQTRDGLQGELDNTSELKFANADMTSKFMLGTTGTGSYLPFSLKLRNCLNKTSGDLSYSRTGTLTVRLTLPASRNALFGSGFNDGTGAQTLCYCISDLRLVWVDIPEQSAQQVSMEVVQYTSYDVKSATTQISATMPSPVEKFSIVFYKANNLADITQNYNELTNLPSITRVEYNIGNRDVPISFPIENSQEIMWHSYDSMDSSKMVVADYNTLVNANPAKLQFLGLNLGFSVSYGLFGINITTSGTAVNNSNQYISHLFFRGRVNV